MDNPKLRPVETLPVKVSGREMIALRDPLGWTDATPVVAPALLPILERFDGQHSLLDIQTEFTRETGHLLPKSDIRPFPRRLAPSGAHDLRLSPRFRGTATLTSRIRHAQHRRRRTPVRARRS